MKELPINLFGAAARKHVGFGFNRPAPNLTKGDRPR